VDKELGIGGVGRREMKIGSGERIKEFNTSFVEYCSWLEKYCELLKKRGLP